MCKKEPMLKFIIFTQALLFDSLITSRLDFRVSVISYNTSEWYKSNGFNLGTCNIAPYQEN
jgi:hypothetical protein